MINKLKALFKDGQADYTFRSNTSLRLNGEQPLTLHYSRGCDELSLATCSNGKMNIHYVLPKDFVEKLYEYLKDKM